jgi:hydrogenase large subunit
MATIQLDPVTKIEGHLGIEIEATTTAMGTPGTVSSTSAKGTMYRGFENILQGRDPGDAILLTQRI